MSTLTAVGPGQQPGFYRLSVSQYHRMIDAGILEEGERVELLEGYLVPKMTQKPPHARATQFARKRIEARLPRGWTVRVALPVTLADRQVEVHTLPSGPTATPGFAQRLVHGIGADVPLVLAGTFIGSIAVAELLP